MAHFPKYLFSENLLTSLSSFIHAFLHAKNQSQILIIGEILMIQEYWNLIGQESFLAITWELDFFQACTFCRMLTNHKNFHFTHISDKTNDAIFLRSPVLGSILTIFGHFYLMGIFSKKFSSVIHNYIWAPNTMLSFRKKLLSHSQENLWTDGRIKGKLDRRTHGQTRFHRNLPPEAKV